MLKKVEKKVIVESSKKLPIFRTPVTTVPVSAVSGGAASAGTAQITDPTDGHVQIQKKRLNIPICDVTIDPDYDRIIAANFKLPTEFLRHTKKIGHEADISIDYILEDEDLAWINTNPRLMADKESVKMLSITAFESIIDILERHTGFAQDAIPLAHADKIVSEKLNWPLHITAKLLPEIYQYWIAKRERLQKPLCRKYWPQTSATDQNPHHVFRPRDKERYRLRKQQKKNDLESFRKMQQLRNDMQKARELLQLVLERELLKEAELDVDKEIFERTLFEIDPENHFNITPSSIPFRHTLRFENLLKPNLSEKDELAPSGEVANGASSSAASSGKLTLVVSKSSLKLNAAAAPSAGPATAVPVTAQPAPAPAAPAPAAAGPVEDVKKEKRDKKRKKVVETAQSAEGAPTVDDAAGATSEWLPNELPSSAPSVVIVNPAVPGPRNVYNPKWPSFMNDMPIRSQYRIPRSLSDYVEELELRDCDTTSRDFWGALPGVSVSTRNWGKLCVDSAGIASENEATNSQSLSEKSEANGPVKYRSRGRIGRGGRLVLDRIPVYGSNLTYITSTNHKVWSEFTPISVASLASQDAAAAVVSPMSMEPIFAAHQPSPLSQYLQSLPAVLPISRPVIPMQLEIREQDIYACSDSEDERIELGARTFHATDPKAASGAMKYALRI